MGYIYIYIYRSSFNTGKREVRFEGVSNFSSGFYERGERAKFPGRFWQRTKLQSCVIREARHASSLIRPREQKYTVFSVEHSSQLFIRC